MILSIYVCMCCIHLILWEIKCLYSVLRYTSCGFWHPLTIFLPLPLCLQSQSVSYGTITFNKKVWFSLIYHVSFAIWNHLMAASFKWEIMAMGIKDRLSCSVAACGPADASIGTFFKTERTSYKYWRLGWIKAYCGVLILGKVFRYMYCQFAQNRYQLIVLRYEL